MRVRGSRKILGGLTLAAYVALTCVAGLAQQPGPAQGQGGGGDGERAERHWGRGGEGHGRHGGMGGFFFGGRFAERLNLTDAQKEQMRQIAERYRETFRAQHERGGEERRAYDPLSGGAFDEAAVRAAAQARANAQVEREVAHARMMYEIYNVLTPEQKAQLAAERQQREQRRQEFRSRRGAGRQPQQ